MLATPEKKIPRRWKRTTKRAAVREYHQTRDSKAVAEKYGVSKQTIYNWQYELQGRKPSGGRFKRPKGYAGVRTAIEPAPAPITKTEPDWKALYLDLKDKYNRLCDHMIEKLIEK